MAEKFMNKYRIPSARLKNWDYRSSGAYFITICTKDRIHYFGHIVDHEMIHNAIGMIAQQCWIDIPNHFPFIELGNFVIMPNHVHGILIIHHANFAGMVETLHATSLPTDVQPTDVQPTDVQPTDVQPTDVQPTDAHPTDVQPTDIHPMDIPPNGKNEKMAGISPKQGTISTVIRSYKSAVTKAGHCINPCFAWQTRYYDSIIRNAFSFQRIQTYIGNNPANWNEDNLLSS